MLHLHRAERADGLVAMLAALLLEPLADPLIPEVVAVPTRGVERWLTQQLAGRLGATPGRADGVCANVTFPFPGALVGGAVATASGVQPDADPWSTARSVWPLLDVVDANFASGWLAPFADHVRHASPPGELRRFSAVRHVADLFDRYAVHRPEMVRHWASARATDLLEEDAWQPTLWRALRAHIGLPSPAERLPDACALLRDEPQLLALPERLSLFGLTRLPASYLDVLSAVAAGRDVHLFLLHPSPALWDRITPPPRPPRRREDPTATLPRNPLLTSWGRDAREMQLVMGTGWRDHHQAMASEATTLLGRIQADVRADRPPAGRPLVLAGDDRSIRIHACHGRSRQVEVLRDDIAHLLADDPSLEPRDVIVMCPDIEAYAPLITAVFGAGEDDVPDLRVRLADRSIRQTNPLLGVVARVLELASGRMTASEVLDLAGREPVRRRFGFDDDDLGRLQEWVASAGIRWGLDAAHRAPFQLDRLADGTWQAGLDRTLLGVTMADEHQRMFGGVVPLDDVDSGDIDLAGRFAHLVDRLAAATVMFSAEMSVREWFDAIRSVAADLAAVSDGDGWQAVQLDRVLTPDADSDALLTLADVRAVLGERLRGRPTRANFRTGHLTVCTLVPMRSVPHRVVCLLGLDDGAFPRNVERDGDDLLLADPRVGDHDARSEDRQLLLDALMAATDHLVITYTGQDERTNLERPPAVPIGELLDVIEQTAGPVRDQIVVRHPLQPFDPRNFSGDAPWSFDTASLAGARALCGPRTAPGPFLAAPLPGLDEGSIELLALERFVRHPVQAFLRRRLALTASEGVDEIDDALPVELDGLAQWQVGERLLVARLAGDDLAACVAAERRRGQLPPGALGGLVLDGVVPAVEMLVAAAAAAGPHATSATSLDVNVRLDDGTQLVGTVPDVRGDAVMRVTYSRLAPNQRLLAWVRFLAVTAAWPERAFQAITVGRRRGDAPHRFAISVAHIGPVDADAARRELGALIDLYRRGMREPLPLYSRTSAAWAAEQRRRRSSAEGAARRQWTTSGYVPAEDRDPAHRLVLGGVVPFDALLAHPPAPGEDAWGTGEVTRLGCLARRLWDPLLDREDVSDL